MREPILRSTHVCQILAKHQGVPLQCGDVAWSSFDAASKRFVGNMLLTMCVSTGVCGDFRGTLELRWIPPYSVVDGRDLFQFSEFLGVVQELRCDYKDFFGKG